MPSVAIIGTRGYPSYYGGFETAVRRLAPYLIDHGWDVTVYGRPGATKDDDPGRDERVRTVVTRGMERKSLSTLTYGWTAARHARRQKPDVALVMNVANGYWLPILERAGIPTIVNVDGIEWDRQKWGRIAKAVFRRGAVWTGRHASQLVFDAREIERRWAQDFDRQGVFIPYGSDLVETELPVEPGLQRRGYALVVARFVPENTIPEFFEAAKIISRDHDVVIVGSSGYGGELDEAAKALQDASPRVRWLGHVRDDRRLLSLWQHAGAYFHGHSVGGTNPALVQAMAAGAPVVARDTVYNREVLGVDATFVPADPEQIARAVIDMIADPERAERLASVARARAAEFYSWEGVNAAYDAALRELAEGRRPVERGAVPSEGRQ